MDQHCMSFWTLKHTKTGWECYEHHKTYLQIVFRLLIVEFIAFDMQKIHNLNMATTISLHYNT